MVLKLENTAEIGSSDYSGKKFDHVPFQADLKNEGAVQTVLPA
jgi:hypothetical protein